MATLYVTSLEDYSGKSALCIGLGNKFISRGLTVGYMKPVATATAKWIQERLVSEDARFMKQALSLPEPLEILSPVVLTPELLETVLSGGGHDYAAVVRAAYDEVSANKDVVLLEGTTGLVEGAIIGLSATEVAHLLNARVLLVVRYKDDLSLVEDPLVVRRTLGDALIGVVFNVVPPGKMSLINEKIRPYLNERGIKVLAVLPQERVLFSVSVNDLAEHLHGQILNNPEQGEELVENLMVGAMAVDSAIEYFRRKDNKAVITGGDRADIQLAALQTSTRCIILTGNLRPSPLILSQAEDLGVPLILVKPDTLTVVEEIERIFGRSRFHQERKIVKFEQLLEKHFDYETLWAELGF
ncbi:MAG: phosphotransacetylase family protein [Anaerolineae bacterium]|jgi:BioD-like phosphotransacetylase family protein|nr:phosphotransacetylase family protein [Anaerolineae bacterium]MDH7475033.1 phosphotransacetylase family protein [Anaerolineae bacterium]